MTLVKKLLLFLLIGITIISCDKIPTDPDPDPIVNNETVLFYTREMDSSSSSIYTMDLDGKNLRLKTRGTCSYPVWYNEKSSILYFDHGDYALIIQDLEDPFAIDSLIHIHKNMIFPRYSKILNSLIFSHRDYGISQIAKLDLKTFAVTNIDTSGTEKVNPVCSLVDDWIYFSEFNGTSYDIYRMKDNGTNRETILTDPNFNYNVFSVSADGTLLVTPKYLQSADNTEYESYLVVYDLKNKSILHEIPFVEKGIALYASLTFDNKYILFVNGYPNNFNKSRNIFRINIDGTNLEQITFFENQLAIRPLSW